MRRYRSAKGNTPGAECLIECAGEDAVPGTRALVLAAASCSVGVVLSLTDMPEWIYGSILAGVFPLG